MKFRTLAHNMNPSQKETSLFLILCFFVFFCQPNFSFSQCANADFENGTLSGWTGTWGDGTCSGVITFGICAGCWHPDPYQNAGLNQGTNNQAANVLPVKNQFIMSSGTDPNGGFPVVYSPGSFSARLGNAQADDAGHGGGETMSYSFLVNSSNCNFTYHYAVVLDDGGHTSGEQPYFKIKMTDGSNNPITCANYDVDASTAPSIGGFTNAGSLWYKPWSSVFIPLSNYIGQTVKIEFSTRDCSPTGCDGSHWAYAYIDAECAPLQILSSSPDICGGQNVTLTAPAGAATYTWSGPGVLPPGNTQVVTVNMAGQYTVSMTTFGTVPCTFSLDTVILGNPGNPNASFSFTNVCLGNPTQFTDLSSPSGSLTAWAWDFDNNGTTDATSQNPSFIFPTAGTYAVKLTVTWPPCLDDTIINVTVGNNLSLSVTPSNPSICPGGNVSLTASGATTYSWSPSTGLNTTSGATVIANPSATTVYTVNGTSGSCSGNANVTVTVGSSLSVGVSCTNETISGANDGSSTATPSGGTSPFTYLWSNSQNTQMISGLSSGSYSVTITDAGGCTATSNCSVTPGISCPTCKLPGWQYIREITIDNSGISTSYTNFQELIIMDTQTPISQGKMNASGNDIRFVDGDCSTPLCYFIESGINTTTTQIWVKLSSLPANTAKTIYMFYGNSAAAATSNYTCVFPSVLTVNSAISLSGPQNYDWIDIQAAGNITIGAGQLLSLNARKIILSGTITGNNAGYGPQSGPGSGCNGGGAQGGSGGGYGGNGGTGGGCGGGSSYGTPNGTDIDRGSGGGGSDCGATASGGGGVSILASVADINGSISVNGENGVYCCCGSSSEAAAGGSGGGILIQGDYVSGGASLSARGGNGGDSDIKEGGGGGGGGRVKIFYCKNNTFSGGANVNGGSAGVGGQSGQQPGSAGTFTTNTISCEAINVGLEQYSVFADAGNDTAYCSGINPSIGSPNISGYTYNWSPSFGLSNIGISNPVVSLSNSTSTPLITDYILTAAANGCTAKDTVKVTVNSIPSSNAGIDLSYCSGLTGVIGTASTPGNNYSWAPPGGLSSSTISNPTVNLTNTSLNPSITDFVLTTTANNCNSTDTVKVTVYSMPVSNAGIDVAYCSGSTVSIGTSNTPGYSYQWAPSVGLSNDTVSNPTVIITNNGSSNIVSNYVVTTSANGCFTTDTVMVTVYPLPTSSFSAVGPVCVDEGLGITYTGNADTSVATFIWDFDSATVLSSSGQTYLVEWDTSGTNYVTLTVVQNGCLSSIVQVVVTVNPPNANAGPDKTFCSGTGTTIGIPPSTGFVYSWSPATGLSSSTSANPTLTLVNTSGVPVSSDYVITTSFAGCTVEDTVTVTVNPQPISNAGPDINNFCSGSSVLIGTANNSSYSYNWLPTTGLSSGTVSSPSVSLTNNSSIPLIDTFIVTTTFVAYGCTTSDSMVITVYQIPTTTFSAPDSVCINEPANIVYTGNATPNASYQWTFGGGIASPGAGQGPQSVFWGSSGTVTVTLNVTEICPSAGASSFDIFVKPFPISNAGNDTSYCSGTAVNIGAASTSGYTYSWSPAGGLSSTSVSNPSVNLTNNSQAPLINDYVVTTTLNGCISTDTVELTVFQIPSSPFTLPAQVCGTGIAGITYTGNATTNAVYTWDFGGGNILTGNGEGPYTINWSTTGIKYISLSVTENGCSSNQTLDSLPSYPFPVSDAGADTSFCSGASYVLGNASTPGYSYLWSPATGLNNTAISNPMVSNTTVSTIDSTQYIVTTTSNNCVTSDTVLIIVFPYPSAVINSADTAQCLQGNSFGFSPNGNYLPAATFQWDFTGAVPPASSLKNPSGVVYDTQGIFPVTLTMAQYGCTGTFNTSVTIYPMPSATTAISDTAGCEPLPVDFFSQPDMPVTFLWDYGDLQNDTNQNPSHIYPTSGTYLVTLVIQTINFCSTSIPVGTITVYPKPEANFTYTPETITDLNPVVNFYDESSLFTQSWSWIFGDGANSTDQNPIHSFPDTGTYFVTLINATEFNCKDTVMDTVIVYPDYNFYAPNAFTPNNDGKNDFFIPKAIGIDVAEFEMFIFDRWGDLIFVTQNPKNPWDGKIDGTPVKEDVYVWVVNLRDVLKKPHNYMGRVTVVR